MQRKAVIRSADLFAFMRPFVNPGICCRSLKHFYPTKPTAVPGISGSHLRSSVLAPLHRRAPLVSPASLYSTMAAELPAKLKPAARVAGQRQDVW